MSNANPKPNGEVARNVPPTSGRSTRTGRKRPDGAKERSGQKEASAYRPQAMRGSHPLAGVLQSAITPMESAGKIRESLALAYWPRVAGAQASAATEAESVRDGILFVRTKSSVWSHE